MVEESFLRQNDTLEGILFTFILNQNLHFDSLKVTYMDSCFCAQLESKGHSHTK